MVITVLGLFSALLIVLFEKSSMHISGNVIYIFSVFQIALLFVISLQLFKRISKIDYSVASGIFQISMKDWLVRSFFIGVVAVSFIQFILASIGTTQSFVHVILFALALDLLVQYGHRLYGFMSIEGLLDQYQKQVEKQLKMRDPEGALSWCEAICQVGASAIRDHNVLQGSQALNALYFGSEQLVTWAPLATLFSTKSRIGTDLPLLDRLQVLVIYISQKAIWIMKDSLGSKLVPIAESSISFFGRLSCFLIGKHPEIAHVPIIQLVSAVQDLSEKELDQIDVHVALTMSEVMKSLLLEAQVQKRIVQEPFIHILRLLEAHIRRSFQRKKGQSIALLMQPFAEIGQILADPSIMSLEGAGRIKEELQRLFVQLSTLESIQSGSFEPSQNPVIPSDSSSSFAQDMPYLQGLGQVSSKGENAK